MAQPTSQTPTRVPLSIIGGGNMGSALLGGLIAAGWLANDIVVVEVHGTRSAIWRDMYQ
jgi:pyrroline-5-carboxylate reductase